MTSYQMLQKLTLDERLEVLIRHFGNVDQSFQYGLRYAQKAVRANGWEEIAPAWVPQEIRTKAEKR